MNKKIVIFGGSGFIGASLTNALLQKNNSVCVVCTNKKSALRKIKNHQNLQIKTANIFDEAEIKNLLKDCDIVVNLIGKLFEREKGDFAKFHHDFPKILLRNISDKQQLIHISALGIEESSQSSLYAKTKLDGQNEVINSSKNYAIIKPSIVFGDCDNFFNLFAQMSKISPFLPLIGGGEAKFSPIYVEDLVLSIIFLIQNNKKYQNQIFEAYGPKTASFRELLKFILKTVKRKRLLLRLPFFAAKLQAKILNLFRIYLLTSDQVELLKYDNIASKKWDNIDKIIGGLKSYEEITPKYLT